MKKLVVIISVFVSSISFTQKENNILNNVTKELNHSRSELGVYIFQNHADLNSAVSYYADKLVNNDQQTDLETLSKKFKINIFKQNIYPIRYFDETILSEQIQYIVEQEIMNNSTMTSAGDFFRNITVIQNKYGEYLTIVSYATKQAICNLPDYTEN
jgi:hypothetical protein